MAQNLKWLCIKSCFLAGGKYVAAGEVISAQATPSATFFTAYTSDIEEIYTGFTRDKDGTIRYSGGWDDFRFPLTGQRQGATSKPDYDFTDLGFLFPNNDAEEILYVADQFPHALKAGSFTYPHIHYIQTGAAVPTFKIAYRFIEVGGAVGEFATIVNTANVVTYSAGTIHQIRIFAPIAAPSSLSALIDMKVYREDATVAGDVLVKAIDFHVQYDSFGSGQEYTK